MREINKAVVKKDAAALVTGKPVYTNDLAPADCLIVKALRSPHAHAVVAEIDTALAMKVPGIECVLTYKDVPKTRFTIAGQTYPEPSPYDRLIIDRKVRFVGDVVALVAGATEQAVDRAMKLIKVKYHKLSPVLDLTQALDNESVVHDEADWRALINQGGDNKRNLCASADEGEGDVDGELAACDVVVENIYHTKQCQQSMMETFRAYSYLDAYGRLNIVSSTQVPFHVRRIVATALELPKAKIRVIKPRIGGGFGAKQTAVMEVYPAIVTKLTGKSAKMVYSRYEALTASTPRHEAQIKVRVGADRSGHIKAIELYALWNAGAYGEHSTTTVTLAGHKAIPLYSRNLKAFRFKYDVVYTNTVAAGAYRGYGATQGQFALESAVNELAQKLNMDSSKLRELNIIRQGEPFKCYFGETALSCTLDKCIARAKEMIGWSEKYPRYEVGGKVRGLGMAVAMQGSGIANVDTGAVSIKVNDDGFYSMNIGATDMGTGCDTILAQIAAECLECSADDIVVNGVDTDTSPYDSGSYASATTYVTGMAVVKTCEKLKQRLLEEGAKLLHCKTEEVEFSGGMVINPLTNAAATVKDIANASMCANNTTLFATESHFSPTSPPPFMATAVEVEVDTATGKVEVVDMAAVVDCGTVINTALAKVQVEGGLVQGIGMALYEDIHIDENGRMAENSFMQYKLPTRLDTGRIRVEFAESYEPSGPFGAKSIGEVVINTPPGAIADAVYNAVGVRIKELPITPEKIFMGILRKNNQID